MRDDILTSLRPALVMLLLMTLLTGILYPLIVTGVGQVVMPASANGSLVRDGDRIVGSALIGQNFAGPSYFHPRPSAAGSNGYDAAASSGSNLGPTSAALKASIAERVAAARADGAAGQVPADMVTASGSGLDPDISPANAQAQAKRVAAARGIDQARLSKIVAQATAAPTLGVLGQPHVNVLLLNRQLDAMAAQAPR
jgi:potassium-transporting ATPase KdpC subunit